jgi:hypothetical protein
LLLLLLLLLLQLLLLLLLLLLSATIHNFASPLCPWYLGSAARLAPP